MFACDCFQNKTSGIKMPGVSKTSLLFFIVFARFPALTAKVWQVNDHRRGQELTMNLSKTTVFRSRALTGPVFLSPENSAVNLWGRSGRGHCRKFSANFREISANFPHPFRTLSWRNKTHFFANFREFSAEFPQTFRKNPFANDPISELLKSRKTGPSARAAVGTSRAPGQSAISLLAHLRQDLCSKPAESSQSCDRPVDCNTSRSMTSSCQGAWCHNPGREEHSMDQYRSRPKLSENFERHWSIRISGETHMDQSLVHTFSWGNSYGPMVLKVLQKFLPTLVLVHGWLFPVQGPFWGRNKPLLGHFKPLLGHLKPI